MKQKELRKATGIAMPDSLKERVKKAAEKDGRSFSDYVCRVLDKTVK